MYYIHQCDTYRKQSGLLGEDCNDVDRVTMQISHETLQHLFHVLPNTDILVNQRVNTHLWVDTAAVYYIYAQHYFTTFFSKVLQSILMFLKKLTSRCSHGFHREKKKFHSQICKFKLNKVLSKGKCYTET